jgi:RND family efflux transporter MFP subunit
VNDPKTRLDFEAAETPWFLRKGSLITAAVAFAAVAVWIISWRHSSGHGPQATDAPLVSVTVPGRSPYNLTVHFTGAIIARYDMPIGVDGEGGRVLSIQVEAGDRVKRGQVLARLDTAVLAPQVASLRAALEQARADAALAEADYQRAEKIATTVAALSKEEVEKRRTAATTSAAKVRTAEAQLAEAEARLKRTDIVAPDDGIVLTRTAEVGQAVTTGSAPLFRLARGGEVEMKALIAEQDLPKLKIAQDVAVTITGVDTPFPGKVRLLAAVIDPATRLGEVRITLPKDPALRPGAFAHGTAVVGSDVKPLVPQTALLTDGTTSYVLLVGPDNRVSRRAVRYGSAQPGGIVVLEGLQGDEKVVATAAAFLKEGEAVRVANPDGKSAP